MMDREAETDGGDSRFVWAGLAGGSALLFEVVDCGMVGWLDGWMVSGRCGRKSDPAPLLIAGFFSSYFLASTNEESNCP